MHIKTFFKNLKKRASGSVETAIKVLTAVVLGAAILMGLYGLVTGVVLPSTETAVSSMFAYSAEANGGNGGTEIPTPTPSTPEIGELRTFNIAFSDFDSSTGESFTSTVEFNYEYGMTWGEWIESAYNTEVESVDGNRMKAEGSSTYGMLDDEGREYVTYSINGFSATSIAYIYLDDTINESLSYSAYIGM